LPSFSARLAAMPASCLSLRVSVSNWATVTTRAEWNMGRVETWDVVYRRGRRLPFHEEQSRTGPSDSVSVSPLASLCEVDVAEASGEPLGVNELGRVRICVG
jgi:hypothetical protein